MRLMLLLFAVAVTIPVVVDATLQEQRAQIQVDIEVEVTPAVAMSQSSAPADGTGIVARMTARQVAKPAVFHAEGLSFVPGDLVAQTSNQQKSVEVEASISPNPSGTMLTASNCNGVSGYCSAIPIPVQAGTTVTVPCAYQVTVDTTEASWTLDHGLYTDFENGSNVVAFPGTDAKNNSYLSTPRPAYSPFVVYSDTGAWVALATGKDEETFCVSLQITVPASVAQGTYNSLATYTLLY